MARRTALALLVLLAITLGALAAGTPVAGDPSVRAETAGINLGHTVQTGPRFVDAAADGFVATLVTAVLVVAMVGTWLVCDTGARLLCSSRWLERRASRGPPSVLSA